jgi:putative aldouronate transport system substrate-binding protein
MKKKAIFLSVFLIAALLPAALFAGGGRQGAAEASSVDDLSVPYKFSFAMLNWGQLHGMDFNNDDVAQYFRKKFNFEWDVIQTTWADWEERPRIWINSMDMPDLVFDNFNYNDYRNWVDQDLLKRLPAK